MAHLIFGSFFSLFVAIFFIGCICDEKKFGKPNLLEPGYIGVQQSHMKQFDPFCRNDIGPPIPGDRPCGALGPTPKERHLREYYKLPPYTAYFLPEKKR